ncbi:MAG: hypothetical protein J3K34DRAFT_406318 [Monoraphidium minutum]|nr:MAG: hypothetical protein J3K34DRAFT_406318 [Monoraphidium minutum]
MGCAHPRARKPAGGRPRGPCAPLPSACTPVHVPSLGSRGWPRHMRPPATWAARYCGGERVCGQLMAAFGSRAGARRSRGQAGRGSASRAQKCRPRAAGSRGRGCGRRGRSELRNCGGLEGPRLSVAFPMSGGASEPQNARHTGGAAGELGLPVRARPRGRLRGAAGRARAQLPCRPNPGRAARFAATHRARVAPQGEVRHAPGGKVSGGQSTWFTRRADCPWPPPMAY